MVARHGRRGALAAALLAAACAAAAPRPALAQGLKDDWRPIAKLLGDSHLNLTWTPEVRERLARAIRDSTDGLERRRAAVEKEMKALHREARAVKPDTPLAGKEDVAGRLLALLTSLQALEDELRERREAIDRYLGTPVLRLVAIEPGGRPGSVVAGHGTQSLGTSVLVRSAPLEIVPGTAVRFRAEARRRERWDAEHTCVERARAHPVDLKSTLAFDVSVSRKSDGEGRLAFARVLGKEAFHHLCEYAPFRVMPNGVRIQVPFELEDTVALELELRPNRFPEGGGYRFRGKVSSGARTDWERGLDGGQDLFETALADTRGYCTSPRDGRCAEVFVAFGSGRPVVLRYRQVREGEPYLTALPASEHPAGFGAPLFVGELSRAIAMPDFRGTPSGAAKRWLEGTGLQASLRPGRPAPSPGLVGAVEAQSPAAGAEIALGGTVVLTVHAPAVETREVPRVEGLPSGAAREKLRAAGLEARLFPGPLAPTVAESGRVMRQDPEAGSRVAAGADVRIFVFAPPVDTVEVPDLTGLDFAGAERRLAAAGLTAVRGDDRPTGDASRAGLVASVQPAAGSRVRRGAAVQVAVHDRPAAAVPSPAPAPVRELDLQCPPTITLVHNRISLPQGSPAFGSRVPLDRDKSRVQALRGHNVLQCTYRLGSIDYWFVHVEWADERSGFTSISPRAGCGRTGDADGILTVTPVVSGIPAPLFERVFSTTRMAEASLRSDHVDGDWAIAVARELVRKVEPFALPCPGGEPVGAGASGAAGAPAAPRRGAAGGGSCRWDCDRNAVFGQGDFGELGCVCVCDGAPPGDGRCAGLPRP